MGCGGVVEFGDYVCVDVGGDRGGVRSGVGEWFG